MPARRAPLINVHPDTQAKTWYVICAVYWMVSNLAAAFFTAMLGPIALITVVPACFGILVAASMLLRSHWARTAAVVLSWLGTIFGGLLMLYLGYEVTVESAMIYLVPLILSVLAFVMTFVTRWSVANTEGR